MPPTFGRIQDGPRNIASIPATCFDSTLTIRKPDTKPSRSAFLAFGRELRNAVKLFAQSWWNQRRESLAWSGIQPVRLLAAARRIPCRALLLGQTCPRFARTASEELDVQNARKEFHRARVSAWPAS